MIQQKLFPYKKHFVILFSISVLILLTGLPQLFYSAKLRRKYYIKKETDSKTKISKYPKKYQISKRQAKKNLFYYKVYQKTKGQATREDIYYKNKLINHYLFYYKKKRLVREKFYDNLILILTRSFIYNSKGQLIRIEQYDKNKKPSGDWHYFDLDGEIIKIERYRDKKLSYLKIYKDKELVESRYYKNNTINITKYDSQGKAISAKSINERDKDKVSVIVDTKPLLSFEISDIHKVQIVFNSKALTLIKSGDKWMITSPNNRFEADNDALLNLLKNIKALKSFKTFRGNNLSMGKYGLSLSKNTLSLRNNKGKTMQIIIGDEVNAENAYYISSSQSFNEIYLVSTNKIDFLLGRKAADLRQKQFVKLKSSEIKSVSIDELTFINKESGWILKSNLDFDIKQNQAIVNTILNMNATHFLDKPKDQKSLSLQNPKHRIILRTNSKIYRILIFIKKEKAYAKTNFSKTIYKIPIYLTNYLERKKKLYHLKK